MRETPRSLGLYYVLCGLLGLLYGALSVLACTQMPLTGMSVYLLISGGLLGLIGAAELWVGSSLARLLVERPHIPLRVAVAGMLLSLLRFNVLGVLLGVYIYYQLKRLAQEADVKQDSRILE